MAHSETVSVPKRLRGFERRSVPFNRCISSNITMVYGEDGKASVIAKHNTFRFGTRSVKSRNATRVEERCAKTPPDDGENMAAIHDSCSWSSSSIASTQISRCRSPSLPAFHVKSFYAKTCYGALRRALRELQWKEQPKTDGTYDFYWHGVAYEDISHGHISDVHAINKLPGMLEISHKIQLSRILQRMQYLYPGEFDFYPTSWVLPEQFHQFVSDTKISSGQGDRNTSANNKHRRCSTRRKEKAYIVKPDQGRQGDGIYLVMDPKDIRAEIRAKPCIVQEYIDHPLLLEGYKFDLRIYVVIARLDPIEIYLCKEGLARLCTAPYEYPSRKNLSNTFMHLTNYSLNKNSEDFVQTDAAGTGSKRTLTSVEPVLSRKGCDVRKMRREIKQLSVKTVLAILPDLVIWSHANSVSKSTRCFQILGLDVMLSSDMKAHLLEVNAVPSLRIHAARELERGSGVFESFTSALDEKVKVTLVRDTLELIALGEESIDMSVSCLKRVFPATTPRASKMGQDFQQGNRRCSNARRDWNMPSNLPVLWNPLSSQDGDNTRCGQCRRRGWICPRHCPHCSTAVVHNRHRSPVVIKYSEKQEQLMSSDWRFFDHELAGSALLKFERHPLTNSFKGNAEENITDGMLETQSPDEDEAYRQCRNCGGYLNDHTGPGILLQRSLVLTNDGCPDITGLSPSLPAIGTSKSCGDTAHVDGNQLKKSAAHPSLSLPRHTEKQHRIAFNRRAWEDPRQDMDAAEDCQKCCRDIRTINAPMIFGKRSADVQVNEPSFSGHRVMLLRRCANVFIYFNGIKASLTMGATAFRNMARRCNLCNQGALPSIDLLFINVLRQWQNYGASHKMPCYSQGSERNVLKTKKDGLRQAIGLPFHGFIDALLRIASQRYKGARLMDKMEQLVSECEKHIAATTKMEEEVRSRIQPRSGTLLLQRGQQQIANPHSSDRARTLFNQRKSRYTPQ